MYHIPAVFSILFLSRRVGLDSKRDRGLHLFLLEYRKNHRACEAFMAGLFFDELQVGQLFKHDIRRTVTESDNVFFTALTHNPALLHLDEEYCKSHTEFGQRIVNSAFTLGLMVGISVGDTTLGTAVANLGWDEVRFPEPVFHGDTIRVETEVIELRESTSRPRQGIVTFMHRAYNQHNKLVAHCKRTGLQRKKPIE
jgi:acyl dehydratase